jgi:co-chaperonin GroES (HSP10)
MKVMGNYVLIQPIKAASIKTESGLELGQIHISDLRYREAKVKEFSKDIEGLNIDDVVYYDKHAGFDLTIDNELYKVIKQPDIILVV